MKDSCENTRREEVTTHLGLLLALAACVVLRGFSPQWQASLSTPLGISAHAADAIKILAEKAGRNYADEAAEGVAYAVKAQKTALAESLIATYGDDAAEATFDVLRKLGGATGDAARLASFGDDAIDGVAKFLSHSGSNLAGNKAAAEALLALPDVAKSKAVFKNLHNWSDALPSAGTLDEARDGLRRLVTHQDIGAEAFAEAMQEFGENSAQGYIRSAGKCLENGGATGINRVQDSLAALKATPKTGGVDDVVAGLLVPDFASMKEFHAMRNLDPAQLTQAQRQSMIAIRNAIPLPGNGEILQKVIEPSKIADLLDGYADNVVFGCIAKRSDVSAFVTKDDLYNGLRLDYLDSNNTRPFQNINSVGILEFPKTSTMNTTRNFGTSCGGVNGNGYPMTGNGFSGTVKGQVVPEYHLGFDANGSIKVPLPDGTELYEVDVSGNKTLRGIFDAQNNEWIQ